MRLDVYGRRVEVVQRDNRWRCFYVGNEGKKRLAEDISIPDSILPDEVVTFVADLCHEWASSRHPDVRILD